MKCPNDQHSLTRESFHGVLIDHCKTCNGAWFDAEELKKAKDNTDDDLRWLNFNLFEEHTGKFNTSPSKKHCPIDGAEMLTQMYAGSHVQIDTCSKCKGVWLDGKEFGRIIEYLHKKIYSESAQEYSKDLWKEFREASTGKESEVKDFAAVLRLFESRLAVENSWVLALNQFLFEQLPLK